MVPRIRVPICMVATNQETEWHLQCTEGLKHLLYERRPVDWQLTLILIAIDWYLDHSNKIIKGGVTR
jgi:hypothetical protein